MDRKKLVMGGLALVMVVVLVYGFYQFLSGGSADDTTGGSPGALAAGGGVVGPGGNVVSTAAPTTTVSPGTTAPTTTAAPSTVAPTTGGALQPGCKSYGDGIEVCDFKPIYIRNPEVKQNAGAFYMSTMETGGDHSQTTLILSKPETDTPMWRIKNARDDTVTLGLLSDETKLLCADLTVKTATEDNAECRFKIVPTLDPMSPGSFRLKWIAMGQNRSVVFPYCKPDLSNVHKNTHHLKLLTDGDLAATGTSPTSTYNHTCLRQQDVNGPYRWEVPYFYPTWVLSQS